MKVPSGPLVAEFDESSARFMVVGHRISFVDPMTARAAGCIVAPRPLPVAGRTTVLPVQPLSVLRRPKVICAVAGVEHHPPPSGSAPKIQRRETDAPEARRRA